MNISAHRHGLGPKAVAQEIQRLLRHEKTTIANHPVGFVVQFTEKEEMTLRRLCEKLLKYARFVS